MPTENKNDHDFPESTFSQRGVSLKEFILGIINEKDRKYEIRFESIDKSLNNSMQYIKESLSTAISNTEDTLNMTISNMMRTWEAANTSIEKMGESIEQRISAQMAASKEAVLKAENATEKRFTSVNEFREQMADMQTTLVRKSEADIRFDSLEKKLDTAVSQLQLNKGQEKGLNIAWGIVIAVVGFIYGTVGLYIAIIRK